METVRLIHWAGSRPWRKHLASLLPIWLLSLSILAEGFPRPPIPGELAITSFLAAFAASSVLVWKRWMTIDLFLYSLCPFLLLFAFDEISTSYKTPFVILCTLILSAGVVGYQHVRSSELRWIVLLAVVTVYLSAASHAASRFWDMANELGYERCFPDAYGCAPLTGQETPWWVLFFS